MSQRETSVSPLGVITQPNVYGQYPAGALKQGVNVFMRSPGIITPQPVKVTNQNVHSGTTADCERFFAIGSQFLSLSLDSGSLYLDWLDGTAGHAPVPVTLPSNYSLNVTAGTARIDEARGRAFLTAFNGMLAFDSTGSTTPRQAGLPPPGGLQLNFQTSTAAQSMPTGQQARYAATFSATPSTGYAIESVATLPIVIKNTSGSTVDNIVQVDFAASGILDFIAAGYIVNLYRTDMQPIATDPGEKFFLVNSYTITGTDISNKYALIRDTTPNLATGVELYTNADLSDNGANLVPGQMYDLFNFKSYTFGVENSLPAFLSVRVNSTIGLLTTAAMRLSGVGLRVITGTRTSTTSTVSAVSAADMVGIVVGQRLTGATYVSGASFSTILTVSATSFTIDETFNSTVTGTLNVFDVMKIGSAIVPIPNYPAFLVALQTANPATNVMVYSGTEGTQTATQDGVGFVLSRPSYNDGLFLVRATNGQNYSPQLPALTASALTSTFDTRANRISWSKQDQPEAWPPLNEIFVGSGTIYRCIVRRNDVLVFASDGLWTMSGEGGSWRADLLDPKCILVARDACNILDGNVYANTNNGFLRVTEGNEVAPLSKGVIGDTVNGDIFRNTWDKWIACDETNNDVWFTDGDATASSTWIFNTLTTSFQQNSDTAFTGYATYSPYYRGMYFASIPDVITPLPSIIYKFSTTAVRQDVYVDYQPFTGDGEPFTLKQFIDFDLLFQDIGEDPPTLTTRLSENNVQLLTAVGDTVDFRAKAGITRDYALAPRLCPGFTTASQNNDPWQFIGVSARFVVQGEETRK